jgi:DNA polymerase-3 subunit alpha
MPEHKLDWKKGEAESDGAPALVRPDKAMTFVSLHHHTTFSYLDGYALPETHVRRGAELGMTHLGITEHGNVSSHVQLEQACDKYDMTAIYGCELYCGEVEGEGRSQRKNHLTVLAENEQGYRNLLRVVSRGFSEGFYYEPTVSGAMLGEHKEGLIVLSGCTGSLLATSMIGGKNIEPEDASYDRAKVVAQRMRHALGDSYFLEVQAFPELEKTRALNEGIARLHEQTGIPLVATLDAHYTRPAEGEVQAILHNLRPGKRRTIEDQYRSWGYDVPLAPLTDGEIYRRLIGTGLTKRQAEQAIRNTRLIAERCNVRLPKLENLRFPLPADHDDPRVLFRQLCNEGWKFRGFDKLPAEERRRYVERAKYEMNLIEDKGFVDYFLFVGDIVRWAKDYRGQEAPTGIPVGPARGSAAASLVCYLLRITEVNPMHFPTLLFERFIDINRHDLPDIDLDFDDDLRYLIRDRLAELYGDDHVGNIGTWVKFKGKNSLDDVARVFQIPKDDVETVKKLLIARSSGDLRADSTVEDSIEMFPQVAEIFERHPELHKASLLEGNYKGMSIHAAGLLVANGPLTDFCAIYSRVDPDTGELTEVVSLDKYDAEYLNAMKLDALGLMTMGLIRLALGYTGMSLAEMYAMDYGDPDIIRGFQENDLIGIFQFDGRAMRSVNQMVHPDNFTEVCDINALARPGPLHSGATAEYADVKHGRKDVRHWHDIVDEITKHTQFQVVYQEQILQVVRNLGGFSWEEAARIRKIISKKRGEQEFNRQRDKFIDGAYSNGMKGEDAHDVFSMLATAGAYAFNAAHCVSYGMLAYWTMFFKRKFPDEFFAASLAKVDKGSKATRPKVMSLLGDTKRHGREVPIAPINISTAGLRWELTPDGIMPGLTQVKGIGVKTAQAIMDWRDTRLGMEIEPEELLAVSGIGPKTIELIDDFNTSDDPFNLRVLGDKLDAYRERLAEGMPDPKHPADAPFASYLPQPTHTSEEVPYERTSGNVQVTWLGVIRQRNLKDLWENHFSRTGKQLDPGSVRSPEKDQWVVLTGEDDTDVVVISVDRYKYRHFKDRVWSIALDEDLVLIRGYKMGRQARRAIYVTDMWVLKDSETENESDD